MSDAVAVTRKSLSGRHTADNVEAVEAQEEWCHRAAELNGHTIAHVLQDNARGATKRSKGGARRANFDRLLQLIGSGTIGAVYATEASRIIRHRKYFLELIEACEEHGVALHLKRGQGYVPGDPASAAVAVILATIAQLETDLMHERMLDANEARLERGVPTARLRVFGWTDTSRSTHHPVEYEAARHVVDELLGGRMSCAGACRYLNGRGLYTTRRRKAADGSLEERGGEWVESTLRNWILNPALAGYSTTRDPQTRRMVAVAMPEAKADQWLPIISDDEHSQLKLLFAGRERSRRFDAYPLTGLLYDSNGLPMEANRAEGKRRYRTAQRARSKGDRCIAMYADPLEQAVLNAVVRKLRDRDLSSFVSDDDAAVTTARTAVSTARAGLLEIGHERFQRPVGERMDAAVYESLRKSLQADLDEAERAVETALSASRSASVLLRYETAQALIEALPELLEHEPQQLNALLRQLLVRVEVAPASRDEYHSSLRVQCVWPDEEEATVDAA